MEYNEVCLANTFLINLFSKYENQTRDQDYQKMMSEKKKECTTTAEFPLPFVPEKSKFLNKSQSFLRDQNFPFLFKGFFLMDKAPSKIIFQKAIEQLLIGNESAWEDLCNEFLLPIQNVFDFLPAKELRQDSKNFFLLCSKVFKHYSFFNSIFRPSL